MNINRIGCFISLLLLSSTLIGCAPRKSAPIIKDVSKSFFRSQWENACASYTSMLDDSAWDMPGDQGMISTIIHHRITTIDSYAMLENYVDSIAHASSIVIRILTNDTRYDLNIPNSKRSIESELVNTDQQIVIRKFDSANSTSAFCGGTAYHYVVDGKEITNRADTAGCFWMVRTADSVIHLIYHSPKGICDEVLSSSATLASAWEMVQRWTQNRQVSIRCEKQYSALVSYSDSTHAYHVFFPWMSDGDDCEKRWKYTGNDSSIVPFHTAIASMMCAAKEHGALKMK